MDQTKEMEQLDLLYQEAKNSKFKMNSAKSEETAQLLLRLTTSKTLDADGIASQLLRFPADVGNIYFKRILEQNEVDIAKLDGILAACLKSPGFRKYNRKCISLLDSILKSGKDAVYRSVQLPKMVAFVAKNQADFSKLISRTEGNIFQLNYAKLEKEILATMSQAVDSIRSEHPDLSQNYETQIQKWKESYGSQERTSAARPNTKKGKLKPNQAVAKPKKADGKSSQTTEKNLTVDSAKKIAQTLFSDVQKEIASEKDAALSAIEKATETIVASTINIQTEILQNRTLSAENAKLLAENNDLVRKNEALNEQIEVEKHVVAETKAALLQCQEANAVLEQKNIEIEEKLRDAYTINSRESSLAAEKIRSDLSKSFSYLYEDWLEYNGAEFSEENYESLQAIIKKSFRALERSGIPFQENSK